MIKSCKNCTHYEMCEWKGRPYLGNYSGGYPALDYKKYEIEWYKLHGKLCKEFKENK